MKFKKGQDLNTEEIGECCVTDLLIPIDRTDSPLKVIVELTSKENAARYYFPEYEITLLK